MTIKERIDKLEKQVDKHQEILEKISQLLLDMTRNNLNKVIEKETKN